MLPCAPSRCATHLADPRTLPQERAVGIYRLHCRDQAFGKAEVLQSPEEGGRIDTRERREKVEQHKGQANGVRHNGAEKLRVRIHLKNV